MGGQKANRENLVILGTSLLGPEVLDLIEDAGIWEVTAFVENWDKDKAGGSLAGRPIVWIEDARPLAATHKAVCALGTTKRRLFIEQAAAMGFRFATIVHPHARVSRKSSLGRGAIVSAGVVVGSHTTIGDHVIINRGTLVGHNTVIQRYVTLSPGANIAGVVNIGEATYVGMGAVILDRITIGRQAVIGAGAVVTRDVPDRVQVVGIPAKITREDIEGR